LLNWSEPAVNIGARYVRPEVAQQFAKGLALHQKGRLPEAGVAYQGVLVKQPNHFDAQHLLGVIAAQQGDPLLAVERISRAIKINPNAAEAYSNRGKALQELRRFDDALVDYDLAIAKKAGRAEIFLNRGNVLKILNRLTESVESYDAAIELQPEYAAAYSNRGVALLDMGRLEDALESFNSAVKFNSKFAEAYYNRGNTLQKLSQHAEALANFDSAITLKNDFVPAHVNRGIALNNMSSYEEALNSFERALELDASMSEAHFNRGITLRHLGRFEEAILSFDGAITLKPKFSEAYCNRGISQKELQRHEEATVSYQKAISLDSNNAEAHCNLGVVFRELGRFDEALLSFDQAISLKADFAQAYSNRGTALIGLNRLKDALDCFEKAIAIKPNLTEAHYNRGNALKELGRLKEAVVSFDDAIALKGDYPAAHSNRGNALKDQLHLSEALVSYDRAIDIDPNFADANWNKAIALLLVGNLLDGWRFFEWRWKLDVQLAPKRDFVQPLWLGNEDINGKTILLYAEQGLGDTIQFCRYCKEFALLGATVLLEVPGPLVPLLQGLEGVTNLLAQGSPIPAFDYYCPLLSLPLAFQTDLVTIPSRPAYLYCPPQKLSKWRDKLGATDKKRIGLVWSGRAAHTNDRNRSIGLQDILNHLPTDFEYVCLQKELREGDSDLLANGQIKFFGPEIADFTDTAALCELVDLVISVDTSVAHLAGALGKKTWILLPFAPDWRWMIDREDSPWYPSIKLFRQAADRRWESVLESVSRQLSVFSF